MKTSDFQEDVIIKEGEFKDFFPDLLDSAEPYLKNHFGIDSIPVYSVERRAKGLFRAVNVIKIKDMFYVFRAFEKNPPNLKLATFDRAVYHVERAESLLKMGRFYPETLIFDDKEHVYIMHEFLYYPICKFKTSKEVKELFNLQLAASIAGLFLDFNQNHWLYDKREEQLYYVDKDLVTNDLSFEEAVVSNFSQSLLFLRNDNYPYYIEALKSLKDGENANTIKFVQIIMEKLENNIEDLEKRVKTKIVEERLKIYYEMIEQLTT
ncbi:MAG: hypothetical protein ACFFD4_22310 [Candidatus Odinarchaeota archaeon]